MEIKRIYNDPVDENDITNKRYVDKNVKAVVDKTIADTVDSIASGKTPLNNLVVENITSKNLFDEQWGTLGKRYHGSTSVKFATTNASGQVGIANPIKLDKTKSYLIISTNSNYNTNGVYFYDANGIYLSHVYINYRPVPIPSDAYYMTFNLVGVTDLSDLANYTWQVEYIESETSPSTPYSKMKKYGYNSQESMGKIVVDDISCKNLFNMFLPQTSNPTDVMTTVIVGNAIRIISTQTHDSNVYLNCKFLLGKEELLGKTVTLSCDMLPSSSNVPRIEIGFTNGNTTYATIADLRYSNKTITFTIPSSFPEGANQISLALYCTNGTTISAGDYVDYNNIQLEKGTVVTEYTPYKEFSNMQIYSTNEQEIGTWIDGKPLYRKTIKSSTPSIGGNNIIPHGISNIDSIANAYGCASYLNTYYVLGAHESSTRFVNIKNVNETNITIVVSADWATSFTAGFTITLEYTKK